MRKLFSILMIMMLAGSVFAHTPVSVDANESAYGGSFLKEFTVYPNPTTGALTLTLETANEARPMQLKVFSLIGQEMYKETISPFSGSKKLSLDLSTFPKGIYMLEISNGEKSRIKRVSVI